MRVLKPLFEPFKPKNPVSFSVLSPLEEQLNTIWKKILFELDVGSNNAIYEFPVIKIV